MDLLKVTKEEIRKFIENSNDGEYIELLNSQVFFDRERRNKFPQFTQMFDIIKFISDELKKVTLLEMYQTRYDRCQILIDKYRKDYINKADEYDKINKTETALVYTKHTNYIFVYELSSYYWKQIDSYKEQCIKNSNEFIEDIDEIIKDFKSSSDVYLLKTKRNMLWEIMKTFDKFRNDYLRSDGSFEDGKFNFLDDDTIVDNKYIGKNSFK